MYRTVEVNMDERVIMFRDGLPVTALGPGRHLLWGRRYTETRFCTDDLQFSAVPRVRDILPDTWYAEIALSSRQRGVLMSDGVPRVFLRPGIHRYWIVAPSVKLVVFSVEDDMPTLTSELIAILPRNEYVETEVQKHQRGLEYRQGRLTSVLLPGRHAYWTHPDARVSVKLVNIQHDQAFMVGHNDQAFMVGHNVFNYDKPDQVEHSV